ncbi:MAG: hypothetical protein ACK4K0_02385 [Flavobacteriales bacterium]
MRFLLVTLVLLALGCRKNDRELTNTVQSSKDHLRSEKQLLEIFQLVDEAAKSNNDLRSILPCATVTVDATVSPMTLEIDFGTNTICSDGKTRSGKILASFIGNLSATGTLVTITSSDYIVGGVSISVSATLVNIGPNTNNKPQFDLYCDSLRMKTLSNNDLSSWNCQYRLVQNTGENTTTHTDDSFLVSGSASGRNRKGNSYKSLIKEDLLFSHNCSWQTRGKTEVTPDNLSRRYLKYNSSCSNKVACKVNFSIVELEIE